MKESGAANDLDLLDALLGPDAYGVRAVAISSLTGSATISGTSGGLGNSLDAALLAALRQWSDVVLVGAGTVRAEDYGPIHTDPTYAQRRRSRGQETTPRLGVLSGSLSIEPDSALFSSVASGIPGPLILTTSQAAASGRADALREAGADVVDCGDGGLASAVEAVRARGARRIVVEGGPSTYAAGLDADLIGVFYLTVSPVASGSVEQPLVSGGGTTPRQFQLDHVYRDEDSLLFLRYRRAQGASAGEEK
ncbi:pyrimidine reductase family protein [Corynebacterium atypicum]|uniref:pyrimidine reductase family protein n=1 Tax=Corynebacterium atypicum TaxID=191610 RepID=UPI000571A434|nr:pyrimidine reductase family protein [Corynebacterium atypicum]